MSCSVKREGKRMWSLANPFCYRLNRRLCEDNVWPHHLIFVDMCLLWHFKQIGKGATKCWGRSTGKQVYWHQVTVPWLGRGHRHKAHTQAREGRGSLLCCFRITSPVVGKHSLCSVFIHTASQPFFWTSVCSKNMCSVLSFQKISYLGYFSATRDIQYIFYIHNVFAICSFYFEHLPCIDWRISCCAKEKGPNRSHTQSQSQSSSQPCCHQAGCASCKPSWGTFIWVTLSSPLQAFYKVTKPQWHPSWPLRFTHKMFRISSLHSPLSSAAVGSKWLYQVWWKTKTRSLKRLRSSVKLHVNECWIIRSLFMNFKMWIWF